MIPSQYKIIHTTCHTEWGGLEKRIFNESVWMQKKGHDIIIIAPEDTPLLAKSKAHGFKTYEINFRRLSTIRDYKKIRLILDEEKPDILNTHGNKDSKIALPAAKKADIPLRILSRHISAHVRSSFYNRLMYKNLCHYVFTTADYTKKHLQNVFGLNSMKVFSIPSGIIEPESLPEKDRARADLSQELNLPPESRFIGFVGRVSKDKGVSTILRAFNLVKLKLPHYHIVIVGSGTSQYINSLQTLSKDLQIESRIHFTGFKENVWKYYRAFECKVLPSRDIKGIPFEGVPQALLEAMYCGCPVIGSKSGGIMDIISGGTTGLLFNPYAPSELAEKLIETLHEKKAETLDRVEKARELIKKKHTIDAMGRNILRIYSVHKVRMNSNSF